MKNLTFLAIALLFVVAALWIAACGGAATPAAPQAEATPTRPQTVERSLQEERPAKETETPAPTTGVSAGGASEITPPAAAQDVVRLAMQDLAGRLGLTAENIRLVSIEAVEWSDASLGCPQPGMMYAQVITPGFRVVFQAQGKTYEYHTDLGDQAVLCQPEASETPGAGLSVEAPPQARDMVQLAMEDLAGRLGISGETIQVVSVEAVEWRDASLGCPQPGMMYAQVITPGYLVVLEAGGKMYEYHTDEGRFAVLCEK